jgi:hypothetical protein
VRGLKQFKCNRDAAELQVQTSERLTNAERKLGVPVDKHLVHAVIGENGGGGIVWVTQHGGTHLDELL